MAQKTILAVAIGDEILPIAPIATNPPPAAVRPYINGLIEVVPHIGEDPGYVVNYYECPADYLGTLFADQADTDPDLIFCMSVRVVEQAILQYPTKPIVAVVSNHAPYDGTNVTGFSADRVDAAVAGYDNFWLTAPDLTAVHVLHHQRHTPSVAALARIQGNHPAGVRRAPNVVHVEEDKGNITDILNSKKIPRTAGVFVLPIDRCFGAHQEIITWQNNNQVPTFWPVTDWVDVTARGAFGGYGVPQEYCGERMGLKVNAIWATPGVIPAWEDCNPATDFKWSASRRTAAALGVRLGNPEGLLIIPPP